MCSSINYKGNSKIVGKKTRKDEKKGKATLISLLGYNYAVKYCDKLITKINKKLKKYGSNSNNIKQVYVQCKRVSVNELDNIQFAYVFD